MLITPCHPLLNTIKRLAAASLTLLAIALPVRAGDLSAMSWEQIIAQAKQEGQVNWFQWYFQDRFRTQVKAFEQEYGITVTIPDGSHEANLNKLLAEKSRTVGDVDLLSLSGSDLTKLDPKEYFYGPINTILPDGKTLRYTIEGGDSQGYAPVFWGNQTCIAYNPDRIKESDLPRTLAQFETFFEQHPAELGFNADKSGGGSGPAFIEAVTRSLAPGVDYAAGTASPDVLSKLEPSWHWFSRHKDQYIITASNADSITRLTSGEFMMVASWEDFVSGLQKKGEVPKNIKVYIPDFGMPGGGNILAIPSNARHKAAALLLMHWLTSGKTQSTLSREFGSAPQNPEADTHASLISADERRHSFTWAANPLGNQLTEQFTEQVMLK